MGEIPKRTTGIGPINGPNSAQMEAQAESFKNLRSSMESAEETIEELLLGHQDQHCHLQVWDRLVQENERAIKGLEEELLKAQEEVHQ